MEEKEDEKKKGGGGGGTRQGAEAAAGSFVPHCEVWITRYRQDSGKQKQDRKRPMESSIQQRSIFLLLLPTSTSPSQPGECSSLCCSPREKLFLPTRFPGGWCTLYSAGFRTKSGGWGLLQSRRIELLVTTDLAQKDGAGGMWGLVRLGEKREGRLGEKKRFGF